MFDTIIEAINNFQYSRSLPFCNELVPYISCAIYIPGNIILSWLMGRWAKKNPEKSKSLIAASRKFSIVYNGFMVALSLFTFIAVVIGLTMRGMIHPAYLVCETTGHDLSGILGVASYTYYVTKYIEAIDTFFLCLRNKYITWLHLYHHGFMFIVTWMWLDHQLLPLPWMVFLNSFIHVLMYYYYLMTDLKIPVPWKRYMTTAQIVQLNLGFVLIAAWFYVKPRFNCVGDPVPIYIAAGANVILVGFFCNFYYKQYVKKKALREQQQKQQQQQAEKEKQQ